MNYKNEHKPALYIDIDGVLLTKGSNLAEGAAEFIKYIADNFEVYWLTTHCMQGDAKGAVECVDRAFEDDLTPWLDKFKPTKWSLSKIDAIDLSKPFLWFDDNCFTAEKVALRENNSFNSWIELELHKYPDQLVHELEMLKSIIASDK